MESLRPRSQQTPQALDTRGHDDTVCRRPTHVGRFRIIRELGRGGGGIVFLARDPRLNRDVALKVPRAESLFTPALRRRFVREAEAAAQLNHPHIVPVFEAGEADGVCYLISAYCEGQNLAAWLRGRVVAPRQAALITLALAEGVAHMHGRGILHRDIKPTNVLLELKPGPLHNGDLGFVPRLTDFGLAKVGVTAPHPGPLPEGEELTCTGAIVGTPAYMAPSRRKAGSVSLDRRRMSMPWVWCCTSCSRASRRSAALPIS